MYNKNPTTFKFLPKDNYPQHPSNDNVVSQILGMISTGDLSALEKLVRSGPSTLNVKDKEGSTLVHRILDIPQREMGENRKLFIIQYLFRNGASISSQNQYGQTPLHIACKQQLKRIVEYLLENGANPNTLDNQNKNAAHYLVEPESMDCKKINKVGPLIPKKSKKPKPTMELNNLSSLIVDILKTEHFGMYMKHIKKSTQKLDNIFFELFDEPIEKLKQEIVSIKAERNDSESTKKTKINHKLSETIKNITKNIENSLKKGSEPVKIKPNNSGYEGVLEFDDFYDVFKTDPQLLLSTVKLNEQWLNQINVIRADLKGLNDNVNLLNTEIYKIIMHNLNLRLNNNTGLDNVYLTDNELIDIFSFENIPTNMIEINKFGMYNNNEFEINFGVGMEQVKVPRIKKEEDTDKTNKPQLYPLTNDPTNDKVGRVVDNLGHAIDFQQIIGLNNLYFSSLIKYVVDKQKEYIDAIDKNFNTMLNHFNNNYLYEIYHRIGSEMYTEILNSLQYIILLKSNTLQISSKIILLETKIAQIKQNGSNSNHNYSFSYEHMETSAQNIEKTFKVINDKTDNYYSKLTDLVNALNELVNKLNVHSASKYIYGFYGTKTNQVPFTSKTLNVDNLYDRTFMKFKKFSGKISDYMESIGAESMPNNIDSLNKIKKSIYENYLPTINYKNHSTYYYSGGVNIGGLEPVYLSYNNADAPINSPTNSNSRIGYLISVDSNTIPTPLRTQLKIPFNDNDDNQTRLDKSDRLSLNGSIGSINQSYQIDRSDTVIPSVNINLDYHLYYLKPLLIMNIISLFKDTASKGIPQSNVEIVPNTIKSRVDQIKREIEEYITTPNNEKEQAMYTVVGKIADQIISHYIKNEISKNSGKLVVEKVLGNNINYDAYGNAVFNESFIPVRDEDRGFKLNFNSLLSSIMESFMNYTIDWDNEYNKLLYTTKLMEENVGKDEHRLNTLDYFTTDTANLCVTIDSSIIDILKKYRCNLNAQDYNGNSPIFYALDLMYDDLVGKLINKGVDVNTILVNYRGLNPLQYQIKKIQSHNNLIIGHPTVFEGFYKTYYENIKSKILDKPDYKNNLIRDLDVVFGQTLCMIDHYMYTKIPNRKSLSKFCDLLEYYNVSSKKEFFANKLPLLDIDLNVVGGDFALKTLRDKQKELQIEKKLYVPDNIMLEDLQRMQDDLDYQEQVLNGYSRDPYILNQLKNIRRKQGEVHAKIATIGGPTIKQKKGKLKENIEFRKEDIYNHIKLHIDQFKLSDSCDPNGDVFNFYDNVFKKTVGALKDIFNEQEGHTNYQLYISMWKDYIKKPEKYQNSLNIHVLVVYLSELILGGLNNTDKKNLAYAKDKLIPINSLYFNNFVPLVQSYFELPDDTNFVMKTILDIMQHSLSTTVFSNFYTAILKTMTKYIQTTSKSMRNTYGDDPINYYISQTVGEAVRSDNANLEKYVIDELPKKMIKVVLQKFDGPFDELKDTNVEDLFNEINSILQRNGSLYVDEGSSLIQNLDTYVYPYYKEIIQDTIVALFAVSTNYLKYIINQGKLLNILTILIDKAQYEK